MICREHVESVRKELRRRKSAVLASRSCAASVREVCVGVSFRTQHGDVMMICREHVECVRRRKSAVLVWNRVLERLSARGNGRLQSIAECAPTVLSKVAPRSCAAAVRKVCTGLSFRYEHGSLRMICREHVSLARRSRRKWAVPVWSCVLRRLSARRSARMHSLAESAPTVSQITSRSCAAAVREVCVRLSFRKLHGDVTMICREHASLARRSATIPVCVEIVRRISRETK